MTAQDALAQHRLMRAREALEEADLLIALFQEHCVKTAAFPADVARALPQTFARRQRSDYADFADTDAAEVQTLRKDVVRFVTACEAAVNRPA